MKHHSPVHVIMDDAQNSNAPLAFGKWQGWRHVRAFAPIFDGFL
jgi:hypothetical protein